MQKKIIALAVAAAFSAPAFADTTVYGIVDAAVTNTSKTGSKSRMDLISGGLSTSRFGVKHTEGLDNGMTAILVLEYGLDVANNTTIGAKAATFDTATGAATTTYAANARQQMLALAGGFGTVAAGFLQTTGYDFSVKYNPYAGSAVDPFTAANLNSFITTSSRAAHAVAYISPNMNGVTVAVNHTFNASNSALTANNDTTINGNATSANLLSANFDQGPLSVGGVYASTANDGTGYAKISELGLGASYDLGAAKISGTYLTTKKDSTGVAGNTDKLINFSAVAPVGAGSVVFGYAKNTKASTAGSDDTSAFTVAYLQALSKTATGYAALEQVSTQGATTTDTTVLAVGLRKKF
ncbi:MAG: porin [Pseudomonadota bacterium]